MLNLFKKKKKVEFISPLVGEIIPIEDVNDEVFSQKMMGDGFAVIPESGIIYAPVSGTITSIFPTKHAMEIDAGEFSVLLHLGIDTVELKGEPFEVFVQKGDQIEKGQKIASMDIALLDRLNVDSTSIVTIPELPENMSIAHTMQQGESKDQEIIMTVSGK